jgi:hypothetical protein
MNQAKLDNKKGFGHHLDVQEAMTLKTRPSHSTYSTTHNLIWEFLKGNTHSNKNKARSGTWIA